MAAFISTQRMSDLITPAREEVGEVTTPLPKHVDEVHSEAIVCESVCDTLAKTGQAILQLVRSGVSFCLSPLTL